MDKGYPVLDGAKAFVLEGNEVAILLTHGFMGTPQSVRYVGERLHERGYTVYAPRLKGHGTHYEDLEGCSHEDWTASVKVAFDWLRLQGKIVYVMGQSMGGTLALQLASEGFQIAGIVLINPALKIPALEQVKHQKGVRFLDEGKPDIKAEGVHEITYTKAPIRSIHQLQSLMEQISRQLKKVDCPVLALKSAVDHVVPPANSEYIIEHVSSKDRYIHTLPNSYHVATMDHDQDMIVELVHFFIERTITYRPNGNRHSQGMMV